MSDQAKRLQIDVVARIDKLEKAMNKAAGVTVRKMSEIEGRAKTMTERLDKQFAAIGSGIKGGVLAALGGVATGALGALAPLALLDSALKSIDDASHLVDVADRIGLTTTALQELAFGFSQAGVEQADFEAGMTQFAKRIGEAATKGGTLADILKANGVAIRDHNGQIRSSQDLLRDYANLVRGAATEQEKMVLVTEAFGRGGTEFVNALNDGAAGIDKMGRAAKDAGVVIDDALLRRAEEMGDRWEAAWTRFKVASQSAMLTALQGMDSLSARFAAFEKQRAAVDLGALAGGAVGKPGEVMTTGTGNKPSPLDARIAGAFGGEIAKADDKLVDALKARYGDAAQRATVIPGPKEKSGGRAESKFAPKTANDRLFEDVQAVQDRIAALRAEEEMLGLNFEAQQKRRVALDLEQTALRQVREEARRKGDQDWQNAKLSPEQVRAIDEVAAAYARQADALRQAQEAQDLQRDILKGAFSDLRSALEDGKIEAEEWGDIFGNILDKIIDKIENDLIDAIFSANSAMSGGGGGGIGGLLGGLFGGGVGLGGLTWDSWDSGGYTGPGGKYQTAGLVHKGEVVFDQAAVRGAGGPAVLESLRRSLKGYAEGGPVGLPSLPMIRPRGGAGGGMHVTVGVSVDKSGNLQAYVKDVAKVESGRTLAQYRTSNTMMRDVAGHVDQARSDRFIR